MSAQDLIAELGLDELKEDVKANTTRLERIEGLLEALVAELGAVAAKDQERDRK